ncbi:MAG: hypothetical protein LAO51_10305 [Acidobacteriia bacterium]|nr:hypothetical protein [Terriglobia bacterium]
MTLSGAPSPRSAAFSVSNGPELIVWGGRQNLYYPADGGRYDPATDTWQPVQADGAPSGRDNGTAIWTGNLMVVWGGFSAQGLLDTGGRYDPASNAWTATSRIGAPFARSNHSAVWTGTAMLVFGGGIAHPVSSGGRYFVLDDPDGDCAQSASDNCPNVSNPGQEDADLDGVGDACDCAPTDATAWAAPSEVDGLSFVDKSTVGWNPLSAQAGPGTVYDVLRGDLAQLPVGGRAAESCMVSGVAGGTATDASEPDSNSGYYYLVRGGNGCGKGTYGSVSGGAERHAAACP